MEQVADDIEILDQLLDEAPPEPGPIHRFQGMFLFFSISLGALGLGASLAYFTREIRPVRRAVHRVSRPPRPPAPSTPGLRELVTLPLRPALDAGEEDTGLIRSRRPPGGGSAARSVSATSRTTATTPEAGVEEPPVVATAASDTASTTATATATATASSTTTTGTQPTPNPAGPTDVSAGRMLAEASADTARSFLGKLTALIESRYAFASPRLAALVDGDGPLAREARVPLPSWMNLAYLRRLVIRALERADQPADALAVEPGKFGAGTLRVTLGDEEAVGLTLHLEKPAAKTQVALVVDDVGYGGSSTNELLDLKAPFSVAILPFYPGSTWSLETSIQRDLEPMLHLPMMPKGAVGKYRHHVVIGPDLPAAEILRRARRAVDSLPGILGVNNHMGSRATESWFVMGEVLPMLREKGLFFVDSVTSNRSVAYRSARKLGLRTAKRTTAFLDNDPSYEGVMAAFRGLLRRCKPGQRHVAILHDKHESVRAMREAIPLFRDRDIELTFAGDMVE